MAQPFVLKLIQNPAYDTQQPQKARRGRPRLSTVNPVALFMAMFPVGDERPRWLDSVLFGSILTAVGQSGNVSNVSMKDVHAALFLPTFDAQLLVEQGHRLRQAQRVMQAARHASSGIISHMERHCPDYLARLKTDAELDERFSYYNTDVEPSRILLPPPDDIYQLYLDGDYYGYGRALQSYRREELTSERERTLSLVA
jgi:hypothetical protein